MSPRKDRRVPESVIEASLEASRDILGRPANIDSRIGFVENDTTIWQRHFVPGVTQSKESNSDCTKMSAVEYPK